MQSLRVSGVIVAEQLEVLHCRYFGSLLEKGPSFHRDLEKRICSQVDESVAIIDDFIITRQREGELTVYILGDITCNEVILRNALAILFDAFDGTPLQNFSKESFESNLSYFLIAIDEIFDDGYLFETNATSLKNKNTTKVRTSSYH
ncbi:hypothetical protein GEMRC1_001481 [Eukaryota sp. GEM-RC1]